MKKTYLLYGGLMAALFALLEYTQYKYFVRDFSIELLIGILAVLFIGIGIWLGFVLNKNTNNNKNGDQEKMDVRNEALQAFQISNRESEVLKLMNDGLSNQEIADRLHISLSTVKSHISNIFTKLDVKRRTQAIQKARAAFIFE